MARSTNFSRRARGKRVETLKSTKKRELWTDWKKKWQKVDHFWDFCDNTKIFSQQKGVRTSMKKEKLLHMRFLIKGMHQRWKQYGARRLSDDSHRSLHYSISPWRFCSSRACSWNLPDAIVANRMIWGAKEPKLFKTANDRSFRLILKYKNYQCACNFQNGDKSQM